MTKESLNNWFNTFNTRYFDKVLPTPRFVINYSMRSLGQFCCRKERHQLLPIKWRTYNYVIKISKFYTLSEREYQSILLHEMIHYYITFTQTRDTSAHGRVFRQWMKTINADGWGITITSRDRTLKPDTPPEQREYLLLAAHTVREKHFLTVVNPHYKSQLEQLLAEKSIVADHHWLVSSDPKYATWPHVRSLRGRTITAEEYAQLCGKK